MLYQTLELFRKINDKLNTVTETLMVHAEKLNINGKYRDAEYIYARILSPSESIRSVDVTIELAHKLIVLYEKIGDQSAAENIQEFLLRDVHYRGFDEDTFNWLIEKLCQNYISFYDRVNNIVLEFGQDESFSAEFARMAVFYRTAALGIDALNSAVTGSQRALVPEMALHIAAKVGAVSLTAMLVEQVDRDINLKDVFWRTPLHIAVEKGPCQLIQVLLSAHAEMEIADCRGSTALLLAAGSRSECGSEIVMCLLDVGANANVRNCEGTTPLHRAARFGTPETVKILLDHDLEVNVLNIDEETPLFKAVENVPSRGVPIARQLLHAGADLKVSSTESVGYLMRAAQLGNAAMLDVFLGCEVHQGFNADQGLADRTMALHAALEGPLSTQESCISTLLKAGVAIETKRKGRTALGTALRCGLLAAAQQLLEQGADVETEIEGERLLCYSVRRGDESATRLLLEKGADARQENHKGESPLIIAVAGSRDAIVEMLLESGGLIIQSIRDRNCQIENPVLHCAIQNSSLAITEMLLEANRGCLLTKDRKGNTALHQAILQDHERHEGILHLLLKYCDWNWYFNARNSDWDTPLHLAVSLNRFKTAKMLLAAQSEADASFTLNDVRNAALQDVGSLLSLMTIEAEDPCFEAFEELKRFCQTLTPQPPLTLFVIV